MTPLPIYARRCLTCLQERWERRPDGQNWIDVTYDQFVAAGVHRSLVKPSIDLLLAYRRIERAAPVKGNHGHPRSAFRLLDKKIQDDPRGKSSLVRTVRQPSAV